MSTSNQLPHVGSEKKKHRIVDVGVDPTNRGVNTPKWMVKIMENPINPWMIWGYPYFWKPPCLEKKTQCKLNEQTHTLGHHAAAFSQQTSGFFIILTIFHIPMSGLGVVIWFVFAQIQVP